ncbi:MAG TPA: NAD(P)-binding domain-containing protein [Gaiellaceae bacterium]|nr:NAD(P)-binding domain-containing protein [Gaiellaceae bacterium]
MEDIERPFPPGHYDVVVVGSGPGGLQTSHCLSKLGVEHALISQDEAPGGMFRRFPIFERLISWTKPDAPFERGTREYEWYDHNSLLGDPGAGALAPEFMDRSFDVPSRAEMEAALVAFTERAGVQVRYGCRWTGTRRDGDAFVLETDHGEYRCRFAVFAIGVTQPWTPPIRGSELATHYVGTRPASGYRDKRVVIIGKRNSAFEVGNGLLPWARELVLVSPRPVQLELLPHSPLRLRYLQPYEEYVRGGAGTYVVNAAIQQIERADGGLRVVAEGTTWPGRLEFDADDVILATGFEAPLGDLRELGVATVLNDRIPALSPFFESLSAPGLFFAGNITAGSRGIRKHGIGPNSTSVNGFRYNARVLAEHLAERLGIERPRPRLEPDELVPFLLRELSRAPELWIQKTFLGRVVSVSEDGLRDEGIVPLEHFLDAGGGDAVCAAVEMNPRAVIYPALYVRRGGRITEHELPSHPVHAFEGHQYARDVEAILAPLLRR